MDSFLDVAEDMFIEKKKEPSKDELLRNAKHDLEIANANLKVIKAKKHYAELRGNENEQ